ncbi:hypothetical protein DFJ58DRAFT_812842 [Suillus subalutaceus]|uniref:uncharacterized protein n=1 Tax=Suillus subalutaceus TaxID=48586 RepID=UPI001B86E85D|nr:uncharacterized protein DFJ58DRAFT_812842 [Suillus subalutaceus]KAG1839223.1 hypothetical protein DFJ58DRAFT_812842 [Suillus subalutaceus]
MNFRKIILKTVGVMLSSFGILLSLLAMSIQTLIPSVFVFWTIARRVKRPVPGPVASPAPSSPLSTRSNNIMHSSIVDGEVPQSHARVDLPASPMPATELPVQRSNRGEVSEAHKVFKRHSLSVSPSFNACRTIASSKQRLTHLKGRNSTGSFYQSRPSKNPDPPLRTQPYAAPYFFPAPGTPEAIDYVTKTREELLQPSGFMHTSAFTLKRNKRTYEGVDGIR